MFDHEQVWGAVENVASAHNMSCSRLAVLCGLNATTFNKSKRWTRDGKPRWLSTATISKILRTLNMTVREFAEYFPPE